MQHTLYQYITYNNLNKIYLAVLLRRIGLGLVGIFIPLYLYKIGYSIVSILFFFLIQSVSFIVFSPIGGKILSKTGYKSGILISAPILLSSYLFLNTITAHPSLFYITPASLAIADFLFYVSYHNIFVQKSDRRKRGTEIAVLNILMMIVGATTPFIGGLIAEMNFSTLFLVSSLFIVISFIPFIFIDNVKSNHDISIKRMFSYLKKRGYFGDFISFSAYGIERVIDFILWPIFILLTVGNLEKTGIVVSITSIVSILIYYIFGKISDSFDKKRIITYVSYIYSLFFTLRIFSQSMQKIIFLDSLKSIGQKAIMIPFVARIYELTEESPNYLEFTIIKENVFKMSRTIILPILILIFSFAPSPFITSFIIGGIAVLGYRYIT